MEMGDYKSNPSNTLKGQLKWAGDLTFQGRTQRGYELDFDGKVEWGCAPTEALLLSLAGCMSIDVVSILQKQRVELAGLKVDISGERNPTPPQYFTSIHITLHLTGEQIDRKKVDRAIELSQEKYCSVRHTLRPDIKITIEAVIEEA